MCSLKLILIFLFVCVCVCVRAHKPLCMCVYVCRLPTKYSPLYFLSKYLFVDKVDIAKMFG